MSARSGTSGVDWGQAANIGKSLLLSPLFGFALAATLLLVMKAIIKDKRPYEAPKGAEPPPFWMRSLLILTCTGVSFSRFERRAKGDGFDHAHPHRHCSHHLCVKPCGDCAAIQDFIAVSTQAADTFGKYVQGNASIGDPRDDVTDQAQYHAGHARIG